ncbi:MAG TPA: glycosyltransferase family 39 protein, partial [bacterium]|nr:glycosyltransferase family 39 protein [bacterium]
MNNLWMGLGLARLWMEPLWLIGFILLTILFLADLLKVQRQEISFHLPGGLDFPLYLICGFYMIFLFLHSLLPETFYDSLNYFLGMPAFWLWNHGICDYPTHLLSGYFHGGSLFFLNGFVLAGTEGAKVLAAFVLFWTALACGGWAREWGGARVGAVAATAVLSFPLLYLNSWAVRVDGLLTFVLLLFFYTVEKAVSQKEGIGWVAAAGIFAGLALSIKPTAVVALSAALLALLWRDGLGVLKKRGWLVFAGILAFEVGPWLVKNACFAGNPFFPYAISRMGGRQFPAWSYARLLHENQQFLPMDHGVLSILNLPWRLTMPGAGDDQFIGPLFLALLPLFLFLRFKDPSLKFMGRTLLLSFLFGLTLSHMLRF